MRTFPSRRRAALASASACLLLAVGCGSATGHGRSDAPADPDAGTSQSALVRTLRKLVPTGTLTDRTGTGTNRGKAPGTASLTLRKDGRTGLLDLSANRLPVPVSPLYSGCPDRALNPFSTCTTTHRRGAVLTSEEQPVDPSRAEAGRRVTVVLTSDDGRQLVLSESPAPGGPDRAGAAPGPTAPPLTPRQLAAVAVSADWQPILAALPAAPDAAAPGVVQTVPADRITGIVTGALPRGLRVADAGGQPGFGHLTVDDGRGRCLVAVTVQRWKPGDPDIGEVFGKARQLPDGTRVLTSRAPSAKGGAHAVEWQADTLTTDGLRVLVAEVNARAYRLPGTRSTPVLSVGRLVRIARAPAWGEAAGSPSPLP